MHTLFVLLLGIGFFGLFPDGVMPLWAAVSLMVIGAAGIKLTHGTKPALRFKR